MQSLASLKELLFNKRNLYRLGRMTHPLADGIALLFAIYPFYQLAEHKAVVTPLRGIPAMAMATISLIHEIYNSIIIKSPFIIGEGDTKQFKTFTDELKNLNIINGELEIFSPYSAEFNKWKNRLNPQQQSEAEKLYQQFTQALRYNAVRGQASDFINFLLAIYSIGLGILIINFIKEGKQEGENYCYHLTANDSSNILMQEILITLPFYLAKLSFDFAEFRWKNIKEIWEKLSFKMQSSIIKLHEFSRQALQLAAFSGITCSLIRQPLLANAYFVFNNTSDGGFDVCSVKAPSLIYKSASIALTLAFLQLVIRIFPSKGPQWVRNKIDIAKSITFGTVEIFKLFGMLLILMSIDSIFPSLNYFSKPQNIDKHILLLLGLFLFSMLFGFNAGLSSNQELNKIRTAHEDKKIRESVKNAREINNSLSEGTPLVDVLSQRTSSNALTSRLGIFINFCCNGKNKVNKYSYEEIASNEEQNSNLVIS